MMNFELVNRGFRSLLSSFAPYIAMELSATFGKDKWWSEAVLGKLWDDQKRDLPSSGDWAQLVDSLDILCCLTLFVDVHWKDVFRRKLSIDHRTWANELKGVRNKIAHLGGEDYKRSDTWRALDTMSRLAEQIDAETARDIRSILRSMQSAPSPANATLAATKQKKEIGILESSPQQNLPSWREVIEPHPDVAEGRYKNAEFAADLSQVARGEGAPEYLDPVEFFSRTFVTEGMAGLLEQALRRVNGMDGEPVIQLKTAFGGGKTHSMLALYHMMHGHVSVDDVPALRPVLDRIGMNSLPKANVAVLVGTALDPSKIKRPNHIPGITIHTLWGEMAAQLAHAKGDMKIYDLVKESDKQGVSPSSETLKELFDACAPCLVLMDELVAYARNIHGKTSLPAGTFDNFIYFVQAVTEAARASKNSIVVASIPESDIEAGGEVGKIALETIEHTFGRMESIWKPVTANEGFEVVRRRLFLECKDIKGRNAVCAAFSGLYNTSSTDFPPEAKELDYRNRMVSCYPIHPEVFDRLYSDWSTLERFQRTRGVLRLMAAVVYELWMGNDAGLMIMPGSIPLDVPTVRDELTRHLADNWNGIVDKEVDGKDSVPFKADKNGRYGRQLAARRVARTIMLGSAPTSREQGLKGIENARIRLGVVQPGENISVFVDALSTLRNSLAYLYTNPSGDRYWYDNRATLRKTAEDRAQQFSDSDVEFEIEERLKDIRNVKPFVGRHICPRNTNDVPDEQTARLVVLCPSASYKQSLQTPQAMTAVENILQHRGTSPRIYKNMLTFLAPDQDFMAHLKQAVRRYLAWKSIKDDSETLNLDATQNKETENSLASQNRTVDDQIKETYCWLIIPYIDRSDNATQLVWEIAKLSGRNESIIEKSAKEAMQKDYVVSKWAPMLLKMELDKLLWAKDSEIEIKRLWEFLCTYCYLPRLVSFDVLEETIREGINSNSFFAYAAGIENGRYVDLKHNCFVGTIDRSGYLVKISSAEKQIAADEARLAAKLAEAGAAGNTTSQSGNGSVGADPDGVSPGIIPGGDARVGADPTPPLPRNRRFFMSADLNATRINRDVQNYVEEVINHLAGAEGARVRISLEVEVEIDDGFSQQIVQTVSENCRTLGVRDSGFEE